MKHYKIALLSLLLAGCALITLATKGRSHPKAKGKLSVKGLGAPVVISRDELWVPHIRAQTEQDAFFALGFVHAQDRLFQMDLLRRFTYGKISEWLGERSAQLDLFMRGLDFQTRATSMLSSADPKLAENVRAYCAGVNEGAAKLKALPPEYRLLKVDFEPWQPQDSLAVVFLNSLNLATNPGAEMFAFMLRKKLDAASLDALLRWDQSAPPVDPYWDSLRSVEVGDFTKSAGAFLRYNGLSTKPAASNNWVIGPQKSADGAPIVANDPHLSQQVPSLWYVADIKGGDVHVAGATFPGSPFILTGHNEKIAWGVTNTMADYIDFALVERSGDDGYILAGQQKKLRKLSLSVKVKDKPSVAAAAYWTELGPVLTELTGTHLMVLQWHAFVVKDETGSLFYGLNKAGSVEEALTVVKRPSIVSQNLVVADVSGDFAWQVIGSVIKRRGFTGRVPYPASDPGYGWDFFTELPGERRPERGFIQTANSKSEWPETYAITTDYVPPWRYDRIGEVIAASNKVTADDMRRLQLDTKDLNATQRLKELMEGFTPKSPEAKRCYDLLQSWDRSAETSSVGATIWVSFLGDLNREILLDDLGEVGFGTYQRITGEATSAFPSQLTRFLADKTAGVENALASTCKRLSQKFGADPTQWRWGKAHSLFLEHPFASSSKALEDWNMVKAPLRGNDSTVSVAGTNPGAEEHITSFLPSIRIVTPLSDVSKATFSYPGGQSGQPKHEHYRDLYNTHIEGGALPIYFSEEDVNENAKDVLTLSPAH